MPETAEARDAGASTSTHTHQLRYYIALSSPPTRCDADGTEPFMRPEVGFTPRWFHEFCGIDFSETWHEDTDYRLKAH